MAWLLLLSTTARADPNAHPPSAPTEISVTGERPLLRHVARDHTAASTVVGEDRLERAGQTAADILESVPGLTVQRSGAPSDLATASIRGSSSAQLPVYIAGIRINDDVSGSADLSTVPLWMMNRAEIFRGNAPDNSDHLGLAGALFFWPKLPHENRLGAGIELGSFGERGVRAAAEIGHQRAGALMAVRQNRADNDFRFKTQHHQNFTMPESDAIRRNADAHTMDAWAIGRYRWSERAELVTVINAFDREQGVSGLDDAPAWSARAHARRLLAGASGYLPCAADNQRCRIEVDSSLLAAHLTIRDPYLKIPSLRTSLQHNEGQRATERLGLALLLTPELRLFTNATAAFEHTRTVRAENLPRRGDRTTLRAAASLAWQALDALEFFALGALECDSTSGLDERFNQPVSSDSGACGVLEPAARIGARIAVAPGLAVLANVGRYFRVPTLAELYGSSPLTEGNSALVPETGESADLGVRAAGSSWLGRYSADVFGFARDVHDMIGYRRVGVNAVGPYNVRRARVLGLEGMLGAEWAGWLRSELSFTLLDAVDTTPAGIDRPNRNDRLPLLPRMVSNLRLEAFHAPGLAWLAQDRVSLGVAYSHRAQRYFYSAGVEVGAEQNWIDLELGSSHFHGAIKLQLAVRNLLDAAQRDSLDLPLPGRSLHAELEAWW